MSPAKHGTMPPITIAGAGIAGLTLGKSLAQKGIPTLLLERSTSAPKHNYGITLQPWAYRPLLPILNLDEPSFRKKVAVDASRHGTGLISSNKLCTGVTTSPGSFRVHRGRLESLLREGLDIRWQHEIQRIETSTHEHDQPLKIHFTDNPPLETTLLIGADGPHSQIRKSLAPNIELKVLTYVVYNGKRTLTIAEYDRIVGNEMRDTIMQSRLGDVVLEIAINDTTDEHVCLSYTYSRPVQSPDDTLYNPNRGVTDSTTIPAEFFAEIENLRDLMPAFAEIFDVEKVRKDRLLHWLMRTTLCTPNDGERLAERDVVLVGDAGHAMPILGGEGANVATIDGIELAEHLAANGVDVIKMFASGRFEVWKKGVEDSEQRIAEMHSTGRASL